MIKASFTPYRFSISDRALMLLFFSPRNLSRLVGKRRMRWWFSTLAIVLLLTNTIDTNAQKGPFRLSLEGHYGFMIPHRPVLRNIVKGNSFGMAVAVEWHTSGLKRWHHLYRSPAWGVEFSYADLGNPDVLGEQVTLLSTIRLPLGKSERMRHHILAGGGLGYNSIIWDMNDNLKGVTIGSRINAALSLGYFIDQSVSDQLEVYGGLRITHLSNGAVRLPNLGTNNLSATVGVRFNRRPKPESKDVVFLAELPRQGRLFTSVSTGVKENLPPGGPTFFVHSVSLSYEHRRNWKTGFFIRTDLFLNNAVRPLMQREGTYTGRNSDVLQHGVGLGYAKYYGRLRFDVMMGYYTFDRFRGNGKIYHRFGFRYKATERIEAWLGLKTHFARADHPEVGIIYRMW